MAEYELTIFKRVVNPDYRPQSSGDYYSSRPEQTQFLEQRQVTVTVTEAEYEAIKRALVTHWDAAREAK